MCFEAPKTAMGALEEGVLERCQKDGIMVAQLEIIAKASVLKGGGTLLLTLEYAFIYEETR